MQILCVGKNYLAHAAEMNEPAPEQPVFFFKSGPAVLQWQDRAQDPSEVALDLSYGELHPEVELCFRLGESLELRDVCIGLDWTRRTLQQDLKKRGLPWAIAKAFRASTWLGPWQPLTHKTKLGFLLKVNGELRQRAHADQMRWPPRELLKLALVHFHLEPGDVLMTGTPAGVCSVTAGDILEFGFEGAELTRVTAH